MAYNLALARLLRHEGLSAEGEQRHMFGEARGQADMLLDFDDYAVVVEAEISVVPPGPTPTSGSPRTHPRS